MIRFTSPSFSLSSFTFPYFPFFFFYLFKSISFCPNLFSSFFPFIFLSYFLYFSFLLYTIHCSFFIYLNIFFLFLVYFSLSSFHHLISHSHLLSSFSSLILTVFFFHIYSLSFFFLPFFLLGKFKYVKAGYETYIYIYIYIYIYKENSWIRVSESGRGLWSKFAFGSVERRGRREIHN